MNTCKDCQFFAKSIEGDYCARYPKWESVKFFHYCGEFKSASEVSDSARSSGAEKISDMEIMEIFQENFMMDWASVRAILAKKFLVSDRTISNRLKRLVKIGLLVDEGQGKHRVITMMMKSEDETPDAMRARWMGVLENRKPVVVAPPKFTEWSFDDIEAGFLALSATTKNPRSFTDLYRAQKNGIGKSAFSRLLRDGINAGKITKTETGLYGLNP